MGDAPAIRWPPLVNFYIFPCSNFSFGDVTLRKGQVMKEFVKKFESFIKFDLPLEIANISTLFSDTQMKLEAETPGWSTSATRQKLISSYWFTNVVGHFSFILVIPAVIIFLSTAGFEERYVLSIIMAGLLSFGVMYFFLYRPYFGSVFLPRLETVKENYERKEFENLEKCRKAQLSNQALCLIFYVLDQTSGINAVQPNDQFAGILAKLYGVDRGSLKTNLELLIGGSGKRNNLTERKRTEIRNRFEEAKDFMEMLNFVKGLQELNKLEAKLF
jgi:hypothetical protein